MPEPRPEEGQDPSEIRLALDRILASPGFDKSEQLKSFLRFVVEETIAGRSDQIKAYTIAVDALGRDANFDPQIDPIVRVEAGRLRRALENYYAREGRYAPMIIELPIGHYLPVFRETSARQRIATRIHDQWRHLALTLRENYRLILLIAVVAGVVSISFDLIEMVITKAIRPELQHTGQSSPPDSPNTTGAVPR